MVADPDTGERRFARVKVPDRVPAPGRASTTAASCPPRSSSPPTSHTLFVGHGGRGVRRRSGSPATPTSRSRRRRPTTCSKRSRWSCAGAGSTRRCASRSPTRSSDEMLDLLVRELELDPTTCTAAAAPIDLGCLLQLHGARPPRPQGPAVAAGHRRAHRRRRGGRPPASFSVIRDRAMLRPPPVRELRQQHRGVHRAGRRRPPRAERSR